MTTITTDRGELVHGFHEPDECWEFSVAVRYTDDEVRWVLADEAGQVLEQGRRAADLRKVIIDLRLRGVLRA